MLRNLQTSHGYNNNNDTIGDDGSDGDGENADNGKNMLARKLSTKGDTLYLERRVGLFSGVALIVGTMIGSGIFVSPTGLLIRTGSIGLSFVIWATCGVMSLLGALAYAELGTMNPSSGAEYAYLMDAFGPMPAFLFSWISTLILKPSQVAIICLSFAKYAVEAFVDECGSSEYIVKIVAVLSILIITYINCYSVNLATGVQNAFTAAKLVAVFVVVAGGVYKIIQGRTEHFRNYFENTTTSIGDVATAFYSGLWAYDGWNNLNYVTEEIKNPSKNIPKAIYISIPLVTMCYLLVNVAYLTIMSPDEIVRNEAVAVTFGIRALGSIAWVIPLSITISTFGSANGTLFAAGRLCFAASREGHLMHVLSYIHIKKLTPMPSIIFHSIITIVMVASGTINSLIDFFSFTAWIFYGSAMLALLVMRYTRPDVPRPYKVPIIIPLIIFVISLYLVVAPIIDKPQIEYLYSVIFMIAGMIFYVPFVRLGYKFRIIDRWTIIIQLLLQVAPTKLVLPD
ncbi:b(0,+)-type amino acid transporter 1 [Melanaphis sacchari]|uniref:b(0,+)-type amino acid transporter 1 n=1 Tax=Melanaphis sacchari TaxID=742174 RepID=A0A2H8TS05_9HEMI|nr:b(0,+)-type amino acid transporter 1 [Melanaphis sacchari]